MSPLQWIAAPVMWFLGGGWLPALDADPDSPLPNRVFLRGVSGALLAAAFGAVWAIVHGYTVQLVLTVALWAVGQGWRPLRLALDKTDWHWMARAGLLAGSAAALAVWAVAVWMLWGAS